MDNTNININNPTIPSITVPATVSATVPATTASSTGFFSGLTSITWTTWLIIFLILVFLGFNIFVYLAKGTQDITSILQNIVGIPSNINPVQNNPVQNNHVQNNPVQGAAASGSIQSQSIQTQEVNDKNSLNQALNAASHEKKHKKSDDYEADQASSSVHGGKAGWCYIGEDKGHRSCSKVGDNDKCMSGDIFPTNELCVNPNLRA